MALLIFLALCAAGVGFLLFVLVHFVRDERHDGANGSGGASKSSEGKR